MDIAYWFYKLATKALLPLPVLLLLVMLGLVLMRRNPTLSRGIILCAVTVLITLSLPVSARYLLFSLERQYPASSIASAPSADMILLLTGGVDLAVAPRLHAELGARGDRVLTAFRLLQAGKAPHLLIAGKNSKSHAGSLSEGDATADMLSAMGADPAQITALAQGRNTRETAQVLQRRFQDRNISRVLLVTSAYHMPRSMQLLEGMAPDVIPFTANHLITDNVSWSVTDWIPSAISLSGSTLAINEYLGMSISRLLDKIK